ncbi:MAG TPA: hypothetical protein VGJ05_02910 [Fimbriiglobus sp.]
MPGRSTGSGFDCTANYLVEGDHVPTLAGHRVDSLNTFTPTYLE